MSFPDTSHGWVVGGIGGPVIRVTSDGGATWRAQRPRGPNGLSAVSFVDDAHGWTVGVRNTVLTTSNGGGTWRSQDPRISREGNLYGVAFVDRKHGWIVGEKGVIKATADGGRSWRAQRAATDADLDQVTFSDPLHGWILTHDSRVFRTTDGGASWTLVYSGSSRNKESVVGLSVLDATHVWASGSEDQGESNYGAVSRTVDGGRSWRHSVAKGFDDQRFGRVAFTDPNHGWVASPLNGNLWYSDDAGQSWASSPSPTAEEIHGVVFRDAKHGWAVGSADTILACTG